MAAAERESVRAASRAEAAAEIAAASIEKRAALETEVRALVAQAARYRTLATDLKADRVVDFLQAEALRALAAAGSDHLLRLSGGRYRLTYRSGETGDDEFTVVDTYWGDEERSVKTLSGGETFLASLALAVALSEHVRSLAVTERARLDSLFLDEGFGSLDQDALAGAVEALERLGGDGRLVGIITHVRELAEQLPRIEIVASAAGSRIEADKRIPLFPRPPSL
ncbi:MAG: hypothetical protein FJ034_04835 [Chloroflexi bacterium]|nr:hypothetical protein [Chloroflexota bacterium]